MVDMSGEFKEAGPSINATGASDSSQAKPESDAKTAETLSEQLERHREEDARSSYESAWKQNASQLEEALKRRNIERVQGVLKGVGMAGQAITVVMDEKTQKSLAPAIKAIQLGTTAMNGVLSAVFGANATASKIDFLQTQMEKYADKLQPLEGHRRTLSDLHTPSV